MNVWLYEDDAEAAEWVKQAKTGYRTWARKVDKIEEVIVHDRTGFEALMATAGTSPPDLLVVDLEIDGNDNAGVDAIKHARELDSQAEMPIVVFSSNGTLAARKSAYEAGATSYIKKPPRLERRVDALADIFGYWIELNQRR